MGVRRQLGAVALAGLLVLAGCSAAGVETGGADDVDLSGTWRLAAGRTADGPLEVPRYTHVSLTFDDDGMGGKAACNDYGADYELDGSAFDIPGPGIDQTLMGCGDEPEALDRAYFDALMAVDAVARDGEVLRMTGLDVALELHLQDPWPRADVVGHRWHLVAWIDEAGERHRPEWKPGLRPYIRFGGDGSRRSRLSASSGCRVLEGRWQVWRGAPAVTRASWRGHCPDRLMDQEMAVANALGEPVVEVRNRGERRVLRITYAHANSPAGLVYRR